MCGIVGIISLKPVEYEYRDTLLAMRDSMQHRGPDDAGVWWSPDGQVGLAHRRLAIIDISLSGHQPMSDTNQNIWIVFNGEIYNYQDIRHELQGKGYPFRTSSDTEVILAAYHTWGENCLEHLNGMFAFAIYDMRKRHIFLARDRAGEKPLFYTHSNGTLRFASELKALMADPSVPRLLNLEALNYYLAYGYIPGDLCILKNIHKLPQGQAIHYNLETNNLRTWQYWKLPQPFTGTFAEEEELLDELGSLLLDSVRRQLIADVPVGIMLSGGIDSSLVTAMAARVSSKPVKTFTISFPGYGRYDEGPHARIVADHFGTDHVEMVAEPATVELIPELARQFDEPIYDSSMVPTYLVSRLIRQQATVALGGDGGDELFGGYLHYNWLQQQERTRQFIPDIARHALHALSYTFLPVGIKGRNYIISLNADERRRVVSPNMLFDHVTRRELLAPVANEISSVLSSPEWYKVSKGLAGTTLLQRATMIDFQMFLVDDILVKVDRASMLTSLEVRAPWLDYRIIEFAFSRVPDTLRATADKRKILLHRLAERLLPHQLNLTRKQGFSIPLASWFKEKWGDYITQILSEMDKNVFNRCMIEQLITNQRHGFVNAERLFSLTLFELWRRTYNITMM